MSHWAPFAPVQRLPRNERGRDFVVGDIHGAFTLLWAALGTVGFEPKCDRLLCTGDLIDRGPQSAAVASFLAQPFVHAVCGNHEAFLLERLMDGTAGELYRPALTAMGSQWWLETPAGARDRIAAALAQLPLALEVETARGTVGVIHADVPEGMDWPAFCAALAGDDPAVVHTCLWGRNRLQRDLDAGVAGIGRLFVGHTPQWLGVRRCGNVYAIDTGAVFGVSGVEPAGRLTLAEIVCGTGALVARRPPAPFDLRVEPAPDHPFGGYGQ